LKEFLSPKMADFSAPKIRHFGSVCPLMARQRQGRSDYEVLRGSLAAEARRRATELFILLALCKRACKHLRRLMRAAAADAPSFVNR